MFHTLRQCMASLSRADVLRWAVLREKVRIRTTLLGWKNVEDIYEGDKVMQELRSCNVHAVYRQDYESLSGMRCGVRRALDSRAVAGAVDEGRLDHFQPRAAACLWDCSLRRCDEKRDWHGEKLGR